MSELVSRVRPAAGEPEGALVLLHGRGSDENDLFGLLDLFDPERRLYGVTPGGPLALPPGGRHWYKLAGIPTPDPEGFHASVALLDAFLEELPVPLERVVIGGFSQGSVMSWALALGSGRPRFAGVLAISGFLPRVPGYELDFTRLAGTPVAVAHGELDPIISVTFGDEAADLAEAAGANLVRLRSPVGHTVDPAWIDALRGVVAAASTPLEAP
jgi:phospholipase/carboxylesterase